MDVTAPLKKAKGLGSAKDGVGHWWAQRISAIALIFLVSWVVYAASTLLPISYASAIIFLDKPHNAILLFLLISSIFYHGFLGIQVVIEDYVHCPCMKYGLLIGLKLASIFAVVATTFIIISIYLAR